MFRPNAHGACQMLSGYDRYGEPLYTAAPERWPCAVVSLTKQAIKTPVRADSSGSRGNADEDQIIAKLLFPASVRPKVGYRFAIANLDLRFAGVQPRFNTAGTLDHWECDFEAWPGVDPETV